MVGRARVLEARPGVAPPKLGAATSSLCGQLALILPLGSSSSVCLLATTPPHLLPPASLLPSWGPELRAEQGAKLCAEIELLLLGRRRRRQWGRRRSWRSCWPSCCRRSASSSATASGLSSGSACCSPSWDTSRASSTPSTSSSRESTTWCGRYDDDGDRPPARRELEYMRPRPSASDPSIPCMQ
ncbi:hypothetical protein Zm00014a_008013 [Zea mays]|uniref:Uncharacterized protein n=1 Tax=Zea mays TaxID=4577 RepID=A0A3L6ED38_MAIZE|nr:hypothetical protein Zm00014a_008013 [Zea mays]